MKSSEKSELRNHALFLLVLAIVVGISYGIGISSLSFYGDDWIYVYNYHLAGAESFTLFTQWDRPFSAWVYILTFTLCGESALAFHLIMLFLRWCSAALFTAVLDNAFGKNKAVYITALLFAVYPGFQQQPIAVEFVMHFTSLVLVLLSIWLTQKAYFRAGFSKILLYILSLVTGAAAIFTCEYFIGLELTRPLFLYFAIRNREKVTRKRFCLFSLPYLCIIIAFFIWRIFIFSFTTYAPKLLDALRENSVNGIKLLIQKAAQDLYTVFVKAYRLIFARPADISLPLTIGFLAVISLAVFFFLLKSLRGNSEGSSEVMILSGAVLLFLSGIPFWGTFLDVSVDFPWDRSTLSFSPGVAMISAGLLDLLFKPTASYAAAAVLTALCALFQVQNTMVYISEADKMNDYFWQLAWRAPGLEKGTILASEDIPLDRTSDNDLSPVVNWQYAPENRGLSYDYKYFDLHLREGFYYNDPTAAVPVDHYYRSHSFSSTTEKTLGIFYRKNGCLQIIDIGNTLYPGLPDSLKHIAPLSDTSLIQTDFVTGAQPPDAIGPEPEHGYCYYFQNIALAQQTGDSEKAYELANYILNNDLHPTYAPDLAPVVLAFLQSEDIDGADALLAENQIGSGDREYLCTFWQDRISNENNSIDLREFYKRHGCS